MLNENKYVHQIALTMLTLRFPTGFRLSWLGLKNQNSTADVLFWPIYKLAEKQVTNCFFYPNTKNDKLIKFFC